LETILRVVSGLGEWRRNCLTNGTFTVVAAAQFGKVKKFHDAIRTGAMRPKNDKLMKMVLPNHFK